MAELTGDETKELVKTLKEMGVKPKCSNPADMQKWMLDYLQGVGKLPETKEKAGPIPATAATREVIVTQQQLRLPTFSGDSSKSEVTYDLWRNEVDCLLTDKTYSESQILQAARKSLRGEAAGINLRMRAEGTIQDLLTRLEAVYGTVELGETLLSQFYSAQQKEEESVATWGCRVEDLLDKARRRGQVTTDAMEEMLRTKFWTGLRPELKSSSRHKFDTIKQFDTLRMELRAIEHEQKVYQRQGKEERPPENTSKHKPQVKAAIPTATTAENTEMQELKGMVLSLQKQLLAFQKPTPGQTACNQGATQASNSTAAGSMVHPTMGYNPFHLQAQAQVPNQPQQPPTQQPQAQQPQAQPWTPNPQAQPWNPNQFQGPRPSRFGPCFNCGGRHMKRDCPALHQQQQQQEHLNMVAQSLGGEWSRPTNQAPTQTQPQDRQMQQNRGATQNSWWGNQQRQTFG